MNFKRRKPRTDVRCYMCSSGRSGNSRMPYRWAKRPVNMPNAASRRAIRSEIDEALDEGANERVDAMFERLRR